MALQTTEPTVKKELLDTFQEWFICKSDFCGWNANRNRLIPSDPRLWPLYLRDWVIADLKHPLRHVWPTAFLPSRRLGNVKAHERERATRRAIENNLASLETEMQKVIPADCPSDEEATRLWEAYVEAD